MSFYSISPQALQDLREIATFKEQYSSSADSNASLIKLPKNSKLLPNFLI